ncbi:tyrosine-type recombinase/integrase [Candidatus Sororendozoicomonas aggregata]|uniref:tyrosine-type recombinase/integrase n=1 Tax=Candidatus Sororendozoicomonas aggregata TaxID=3073239 RepID=UPI002ED13DE2
MRLTDNQVKYCKGTIAESMGRGMGAIEFKRQTGGVKAYFRYYRNSKPVRIKIGTYGNPTGLSLLEIRTRAGELAKQRQEVSPTDLKLHLDRLRPSGGTLADLLNAYLDDMDRRQAISVGQARLYFDRDVLKANKVLSNSPASEVTPSDIVKLCSEVHNRGGISSANRLRALLSAAFNYGLKAENDHTQPMDAPTFGITSNPVAATKINPDATKPGTRVLTKEEIKHLWHTIGEAYSVGLPMAAFLRFLFATGGQRPLQVLRAKWEDYDFNSNTVTLIDTKGAGKTKVHVVPLSDRAAGIIESLPKIGDWPFTAYGHKQFNQSSVRQALRRYQNQNTNITDYVVRDIRRTCKNLLIDAGVDRDSRNLLQSHQLVGVDFKHYDRHDHLPEKRAAMDKYDRLLGVIIGE